MKIEKLSTIVLLLITFTVSAQTKKADHVDTLLALLKNPKSSYVLVSAHRGGDWRNEPENSLESIQLGINMGLDMIEIDIRKTKDNQLVVIHDDTLSRTTTGRGFVKDWTLDSLRTLYLKDGLGIKTERRMRTLEEVLNATKGKVLYFLDKSIDKVPEVMTVLEKTGTVRQGIFFVMPFDYEQAKSAFKDKLDSINYFPTLSSETPNPAEFIDTFLKKYKPLAFQIQIPEGRVDMLKYIDQVKACKCTRIAITATWNNQSMGHNDDRSLIDPENGWGWLLKRGVTVMETNRPAQLLAYLRKKGLHK